MGWREQMFDYALSQSIQGLMTAPDDGIRWCHKPDAGWFHKRPAGQVTTYRISPETVGPKKEGFTSTFPRYSVPDTRVRERSGLSKVKFTELLAQPQQPKR